ncbi:class C beta-lactamase [uncultured Roseovarius sp.]|uniref:class C beta-lactamase n=1 Tax=uncultured Roseovarius sp. TaxID=293344 RepID=UPI002621C53A|nr:class C beta-lactamase [uncultured Roseovarius sp.]
MSIFKSLRISTVSLCLALPALAQTDQAFKEIAQDAFGDVIAEHDIPGMVIGVTMGGQHHIYTHGMASRSMGTPVTADTLFELGSISKTFTATLAALAHGRGQLDLYRPVTDAEPQLDGSAFDQITIMDLATHTTTGLPLQVPGAITTEDALIDWLKEWQPDDSPIPMRSYSNISVGLLGRVTAAALGSSYAEAAEGTLFPMLGLENTWITVPDAAMPNYAFGTSRKDGSEIRVNPGVFDAAAYGAKSSANDMLRYLDIQLGKVDITPEARDAIALTQQGQTRTDYYTQAMIWEQYRWPADLDTLLDGNSSKMALEGQPVTRFDRPEPPQPNIFVNKTGSTFGFGAYVAMLPEQDIGVVVLANRNYPNADRVKATVALIERLDELR